MALTKERIIRIIRDAGKIPVERDAFYNPLRLHAPNVIGQIPYLNSVPFYRYLDPGPFRIMPVVPRRMGILGAHGEIEAGPFSLMDYLRGKERLELMGWCIASRDQVQSVMLFSTDGWKGLEGKTIGISDDTATSVLLLRVLLEKRYGVRAHFVRMHAGVNDYSGFDAVLLIGDEALRRRKAGLPGFDLVYDLATEWYDWQKLPFVFAVWAMRRSMAPETRSDLCARLQRALDACGPDLGETGRVRGREIGLSVEETREYLDGFNYRLGERERAAIEMFDRLVSELEAVAAERE
jgi:chorismate dehydratase